MTLPKQWTVPPSPQDWDGNLEDLVEMQQTTIRFLISTYNSLLQMVSGAGGAYGTPTAFVIGAVIPQGWWQQILPAPMGTNPAATVTSGSNTWDMGNTFWSDGTAKALVACTLSAVAIPG